jgi:ribonuclease P/MRP protein subunit POP5
MGGEEMKVKPMLPTLREKKRYLAFEAISDQKNDFGTIEASILASISECVGTIDMAKAGVMVLSDNWNKDTQRGIIRINHKFVDKVKFALAKIRGKVIFRSLTVSGVLGKAQKAC